MKSFKNRWEEELNAKIPALRADILEEPIPRCETMEELETAPAYKKPWYDWIFFSPKRLVPALATCALGLITIGVSLYFAFRPDAPVEMKAGVISVEVNPQALFSFDEEGMVTAVVAANEDADVVLSENRAMEMTGKTVEEAVAIFVDYTAKTGFLDLSTFDAVRISSCEEDGRLEKVGKSLKEYFLSKNAYVAVAEETMSLSAFCERANIEIRNTVEELKSSVERIPALLFEREAEEKTEEELLENYRQVVPMQGIKEMLNLSITSKLDKMNELEGFIVQTLQDIVLNYTMDAFIRNYPLFKGALNRIGVDGEIFSQWYELPQTVEEYYEKVRAYKKARFETMIEGNILSYEKENEAITEKDYNDFIQRIIDEYGSLSSYYNQND